MPVARDIELASLRLDPLNPRLDDGKQTQREALNAMLDAQGSKLVALARDITHNGLSPLDRFLVIEADGSPDEYVVLEGNRRLTALKLLIKPELGAGKLKAGELKAFKTLSQASDFTTDSELDCVVVESRDEAIHWLRLRHGGELDGAGTVDWGATERDRFNSRSGKTSPELQLLEFAISHGAISEDQAGLVSITNLRRLLSDKAVREALGLQIDRKIGSITTYYPAAEVLKPVAKVLRDLSSDDFVVGDIYTKEDRADYIKAFGRANRPDAKSKKPAASGLPQGSSSGGQPSPSGKKQGSKIKARRKTVAPTTTGLAIDQKRLKDIYRELQRLKLEDHTNAGAVLMRVFLELTVDNYMKRHKITPTVAKITLASKLQQVHDDLLAKNVMTKPELAPIRKAVSGNDLMAASIPLFNLYVHEFNLTPSPGDVRTAWDNLELFFTRVWA